MRFARERSTTLKTIFATPCSMKYVKTFAFFWKKKKHKWHPGKAAMWSSDSPTILRLLLCFNDSISHMNKTGTLIVTPLDVLGKCLILFGSPQNFAPSEDIVWACELFNKDIKVIHIYFIGRFNGEDTIWGSRKIFNIESGQSAGRPPLN